MDELQSPEDQALRARLERIDDPMERVNALAKDAAARAPTDPAPRPRQATTRRESTPEERSARLESSGIRAAITPQDYDRIVRGRADAIFPTAALTKTQHWFESFHREREAPYKPYLTLYGLTGRGKTLAGAWLIGEEGGLYVEAEELREVFVGGYRTEKRRELILQARVVVLDDLGTEDNDAHAQRAFYRFVNRRQGMSKGMTMITTNLALVGPKERPELGLLTRYDDRTTGRLQHSGHLVHAIGDDLRRRAL
jgi:chromosomal replication initiation ATPase DnaA